MAAIVPAAPPPPPRSAGAVLESALAAQRAFMDTYGDPLEQMLSVLVYLVPIEDDEEDAAGFWSQAVYSVIDLFGLYRTVLLRSPDALPVAVPVGGSDPAGSSLARPSGATSRQHRLQRARLTYTVAAFLLRGLRSVQVLIEMRAQRAKGLKHALRVCIRVEVVKLMLKMVLRSCMPFSFYVDEEALEDVEPPKTGSASARLAGGNGVTQSAEAAAAATLPEFVGSRSGKTLPAMAGPEALAALRRSDGTMPSARIAAAEVLFHGRPLLHLLMLLRRGRQSWAAWLSALIVDQASLALLAPGLRPRARSRAAALELAEVKRRRNLLWWALLRSPLFDRLLRRPAEVLDRILSRIPVINVFKIVELCLVLQPFYFTTSGS